MDPLTLEKLKTDINTRLSRSLDEEDDEINFNKVTIYKIGAIPTDLANTNKNKRRGAEAKPMWFYACQILDDDKQRTKGKMII